MRALTDPFILLFISLGLSIALVGACGAPREPSETDDVGGAPAAGGSHSEGGSSGSSSSPGGVLPEPTPRYHPPPGFESCLHAPVEANCADGWCRLPPSCFVMGSPEGEWLRGLYTEDLTAVTFTRPLDIQQFEFSRADWEALVGSPSPGDPLCTEPGCPVSVVSWWDALHVANLLSVEEGFSPCYEPTGCTGTLAVDLDCEDVGDPDASVYECEGYRLPTRSEIEYAARAGTISPFYSGDITVYEDSFDCVFDPALELIAWYCHNSDDRAHVGGQLQPNGFGLYDILGNVGEWTNEWQHYSSSPGGENPRGNLTNARRRLRFGGQFDVKSTIFRAASLISAPRDARGAQLGFRLVRTIHE